MLTNMLYAKIETRIATAFRVVLWALLALIGFRVVFVALWQLPEPAFHRGLILVCLAAGTALFRPMWGLFGLVLAMPFLFAVERWGLWLPTVPFEVCAGAFVFSWTLRQGFLNRRFFVTSTLAEWFVEVFAALLLVSTALGASYPSFTNSLDMFWSVPIEHPLSEFEWINISTFMLLGVAFFRIVCWECARTPGIRYAPMWILRASLCILVVFFVFQFVTRIPQPESQDGFGLFSPLQSIHMAGAFALLLLGFFVSFAQATSAEKQGRLLAWISLTATLALVAVTFAKSAWLGALAVFGLAAIRRFPWRFTAGVCFAFLLLFLGARVLVSQPTWPTTEAGIRLKSFVTLESWLEQPANKERLAVYRNAVDSIVDYPITGVGLGQFRRIQQYLGTVEPGIYADAPTYKLPHDTHNQPLQIAAESGLPSLILLVCLFFFIGLNSWKTALRSEGGDLRWGATLSLFGIIVFSLFAATLTWRVSNVLFWIVAALAYLPTGNKEMKTLRAPKWVVPSSVVLVSLTCIAAIVSSGSLKAIPDYYGYSQWSFESETGKFLVLREARFLLHPGAGLDDLMITLPSSAPRDSVSRVVYRFDGGEFTEFEISHRNSLLVPLPTDPSHLATIELTSAWVGSQASLGVGAEKRPFSLSVFPVKTNKPGILIPSTE